MKTKDLLPKWSEIRIISIYHCKILWQTIGWLLIGLLIVVGFILIEAPTAHLEPKITRREAPLFLSQGLSIVTRDASFWLTGFCFLLCFALLGAILRRPLWIISAILSIIACVESGILTYFIKIVLMRPAPLVAAHRNLHDGFYGFQGFHLKSEMASFPSGHSAIAFAIASTLLFTSPRLGIPMLVIACFISGARAYLGDHYWSDVVAGAIIGIYFGCLSATTLNRLSEYSDRKVGS